MKSFRKEQTKNVSMQLILADMRVLSERRLVDSLCFGYLYANTGKINEIQVKLSMSNQKRTPKTL